MVSGVPKARSHYLRLFRPQKTVPRRSYGFRGITFSWRLIYRRERSGRRSAESFGTQVRTRRQTRKNGITSVPVSPRGRFLTAIATKSLMGMGRLSSRAAFRLFLNECRQTGDAPCRIAVEMYPDRLAAGFPEGLPVSEGLCLLQDAKRQG